MKVLLVEDETLLVWALRRTLERRGIDVTTEYSGEGALVQLRTSSFDWVITDYRLPGISGLDVLRQVQSLQPKARVVVISAYGTPQLVREVLESGAYAFLAKPFRFDELIELIDTPGSEHAESGSAASDCARPSS